jgi:hypothetical protein
MKDDECVGDIINGPEILVPLRRLRMDMKQELKLTPDTSAWMRTRRADLQEKIHIIGLCEEAILECLKAIQQPKIKQ